MALIELVRLAPASRTVLELAGPGADAALIAYTVPPCPGWTP
jgi:hypothetical protein